MCGTNEFVAACELLDEGHPLLPTESPHDDNAYTLGRIGDHHIVIACLPKGRYGIASAASMERHAVQLRVHPDRIDGRRRRRGATLTTTA